MNAPELFQESRRLLASGEVEGCIAMVSRAMEAGEVSSLSRLTRATAYMLAKRYEESLADCREVMRSDPDNPHLYYLRGAVCRRTDRLEEAIANLDQALDIRPEFGIARLERALCFLALGRHEEAERDLRATLRLAETALQAFGESLGMIRTHFNEVEAILEGDRAIPSLFMSPAEVDAMKSALH
ncbi:MAG: tetratricopeptide repeat protein [Magnetococcales bacterium]|nr:tetratricopeptide repeat protein [Magnetococcales bacterium]